MQLNPWFDQIKALIDFKNQIFLQLNPPKILI
jgi:hypothetical protein